MNTHTHTHTHKGNYDKAVEFFDRCYKICTELNDTEALHLARVHYGVARSHQLMGNFSGFVKDQTTHNLQQLVVWKDTRVVPSDEICSTPDQTEREPLQNTDTHSSSSSLRTDSTQGV